MKQYIGVKAVYAEPMDLYTFETEFKGKSLESVKESSENAPGYYVQYPDGYDSWSPKHVFEAAYFGMEGYDTVSPADVQNFQRSVESVRVGAKTTNTTITLLTGYEVHGQSACVNPDNYNLGIGQKYAKPHAEDKIWEYLGFVLQWAKFGLKK